jgi:hypothetical protein
VLKLIKYSFIYLAAFIMLLHNFVPHTHESELNTSAHEQIHQTKATSALEVLALIFHEFTEAGEMEELLVKAHDNISFDADFVALLSINKAITIVLIEEKEPKKYYLPLDEFCQATGFSTAWSVRPPPFA